MYTYLGHPKNMVRKSIRKHWEIWTDAKTVESIKSHDAFFRIVLGAIIFCQYIRNLVFVVLELKPDYLLINLSRYTENKILGIYGTASDWKGGLWCDLSDHRD